MSDVTRILSQIESGDPAAAEQLLPLVYDELRKLAAARLAHEKPGQTLQATALVHEAYLRLVGDVSVGHALRGLPGTRDLRLGSEGNQSNDRLLAPSPQPPTPPVFDSRGHFFAAAAEAMRRILINRARDKNRHKRGGDLRRVDLDAIEIALDTPDEDLLALDEALQELAAADKLCANLVKLRFFAGLTLGEAAEALAMPRRTADRHWAYARAWLYDRLRDQE
jgi:RNA polymerase sigma factor (sigma-70 family)